MTFFRGWTPELLNDNQGSLDQNSLNLGKYRTYPTVRITRATDELQTKFKKQSKDNLNVFKMSSN